ncbi:HAD family phosphatase [Naasia sp. SYSU D00948]|uniref:HAD family hydrolase n=1 Tax=Naasia sp. SYSU D00948 TaxID=2817379 RepID=UPI001B30D800|nr:HAD family phosphatase [Naasia sp. SYSU D00948]
MRTDLPAAVLWDMDGTLVDTEPFWQQAEEKLVTSFGGRWRAEDGLAQVGMSLWVSAEMLQAKGVPWDTARIIDYLQAEVMGRLAREVPWRPGARELLAELREAGVPTALVTMSMRPMAEQVAAAARRDGPIFDVIVTGSDVDQPKPHPEPYLRAMEQLGVRPDLSVAIEDSPPGLASAVTAGASAVGVPHTVDLPPGTGYVVWPTLAGRHIADLAALVPRDTEVEEELAS